MPTFPHQGPNREPRQGKARTAAHSEPGKRAEKDMAPVVNQVLGLMDVAGRIEKDGTGIGTGDDTESRPVLGTWSGLAQDVTVEHGRSGTSSGAEGMNRAAPTGVTIH